MDATSISVPSLTRNRTKERDPEMDQTKKGNQWYFSMKVHLEGDSQTKLIHSAVHAHDSQVLPDLLHRRETRVWADAAYSGQQDMLHQHTRCAKRVIHTKVHRHHSLSEDERVRNRRKSRGRAKVEHVFLVIKRSSVLPKCITRGWPRIPTDSSSPVA